MRRSVTAPDPATRFFTDSVIGILLRPGTWWERVDIDRDSVPALRELAAERLLFRQNCAFLS